MCAYIYVTYSPSGSTQPTGTFFVHGLNAESDFSYVRLIFTCCRGVALLLDPTMEGRLSGPFLESLIMFACISGKWKGYETRLSLKFLGGAEPVNYTGSAKSSFYFNFTFSPLIYRPNSINQNPAAPKRALAISILERHSSKDED